MSQDYYWRHCHWTKCGTEYPVIYLHNSSGQKAENSSSRGTNTFLVLYNKRIFPHEVLFREYCNTIFH